jgi:hypothetical protein
MVDFVSVQSSRKVPWGQQTSAAVQNGTVQSLDSVVLGAWNWDTRGSIVCRSSGYSIALMKKTDIEREEVEAFIAKHSLRDALNVHVNKVIQSKPDDPLRVVGEGLLADAKLKHGVLSVLAREVLDASGHPCVQCEVTTVAGVLTFERIGCSTTVVAYF